MKNTQFTVPVRLLIFDLLGCLFITIGLLEWFLEIGVVPELLRFRYFEFIMVALGVALCVPFIVHVSLYLKQKNTTPLRDP